MSDPVQEIKGRLDILDVVSPYVQLKKAGKYHKACCPFHQEKTPSFFVNPERQIAYCFSCEKGGDMFEFIQEIEGLDFRGALELLAEKANVDLPKHSSGPKVSKDEKDELRQINSDANNFFIQNLWETEQGAKVLDYLRARALKDETIREFEVGFAPDSKDTLYRFLLEAKHAKDDILKSTLVIARDAESKELLDRFRVRLMIPIADAQAHVIAFGGRALKKGDQPKYLNSPEYVLYDKGATLFNLSRAKQAIREKDAVIVVEGYFDVMASHQAGIQHVVSNCGTALTEKQFKLMKRYTKRVFLAFDADSAGQAALRRAVETAQPMGMELFVVQIPEGKDAADAVKEDPQLWVKAVESAQRYLDFYETILKQDHDLESAAGKRAYADEFLSILRGVEHPVERDHYLKRLSKQVGTPLEMLYDYLNDFKNERRQVKVAKTEVKTLKSRQERLSEYFVGMLVAFPEVFFQVWNSLDDPEKFIASTHHLGLVMPLNRLDVDSLKRFKKEFENFLERMPASFSVETVYKQVRDQYNHSDLVEGLDDQVQKLAFQAELKNKDPKLIQSEFEKVLALLYFEFIS